MASGFSASGSKMDASVPSFKNKLRVLIVDDSNFERKILKAHLTKLGIETQEAINGKEAIDVYSAIPTEKRNVCSASSNFHLILMDKEMSIMNGPEAVRRLRSMGVRTKIAGVTSATSDESKEEFMNAGIDKFYGKPMGSEKLISLLKEIDDML